MMRKNEFNQEAQLTDKQFNDYLEVEADVSAGVRMRYERVLRAQTYFFLRKDCSRL